MIVLRGLSVTSQFSIVCRFGNIQKYLIHHRNKFINQVDPNTGIINFDIGKDLLGVSPSGEEIDWPTQRERGEASAHYLATGQTSEEAAAAAGGGYLGKKAQSSVLVAAQNL